MGLPAPVAAYLREFAAGRFFEAHEALEGLWWERDSDPFLQGLILFAAAFVKLRRGNAEGARRHFAAAASHLEPYVPDHGGMPLAALVAHARAAADALRGDPPDPAAAVPPFVFVLAPDAWRRWSETEPRAVPEPELQAAIAAALAARRECGAPLRPSSWAEVVREVRRAVGGGVPRDHLRRAVRQALAAAAAGEGGAEPPAPGPEAP